MPSIPASSSGLLRGAMGALVLASVILLVAGQERGFPASVPAGASVAMAVEHAERATPEITVANLRDRARVTVRNADAFPIAVSVPEGWIRTEVAGAALRDVSRGENAFGFARWTLPGGASIVFEAPVRIDHLDLFNPTGIPMHVMLARTDILRDSAERTSILVQESPTRLF